MPASRRQGIRHGPDRRVSLTADFRLLCTRLETIRESPIGCLLRSSHRLSRRVASNLLEESAAGRAEMSCGCWRSLVSFRMIALVVLGLAPGVVHGEGQSFADLMQAIQAQYATIHEALAADTLDGVDAASSGLGKLAGSLGQASDLGAQAEPLRKLPAELAAAAAMLPAAKDLAGTRAAFHQLSDAMVRWSRAARPGGVRILYCPMVKASWLEAGGAIRNPYYGKAMLECGKDVTDAEPGAEPEAGSTGSGHGSH